MWEIVFGVLAVFLILILIGGSGYCMAAPTASLNNIRAEFSPNYSSKYASKLKASKLSREKDVPKANF